MRNFANKPYLVHVDDRSRIILRNAGYSYYRVKHYHNGCFLATPCVIKSIRNVSTQMMNRVGKKIESLPNHKLTVTVKATKPAP